MIVLLCASWIFYGWWDIRFLPLLVGSISLNWLIARFFQNLPKSGLIGLGIAANLGLIGYFKYKNFFLETMMHFVEWDGPLNPLILPIGISFFTFQQISYLVDLKKKNAPLYNPIDYALYVSFFPQLIAGPIVRHNELIPQLVESPFRTGFSERLGRGLTLFTIGLAKKVLVADMLGKHANAVFETANSLNPSTLEAWTGTLAFSFQIYFDFSAYSDMAIGIALIFGFALPMNFNSPYKAVSLQDFWRRWHMTLSSFLRDYLYIPLGGSRHGTLRRVGATGLTMALCGLWHGAGWTFVLWGIWHGCGLIVNFLWVKLAFKLPRFAGWAVTLLFVVLGWVFFRAENFQAVATMFQAMSGWDASEENLVKPLKIWKLLVVTLVVLTLPNSQELAFQKLRSNKLLALGFGLLLGALFLELGKGDLQEFIYFEF